VESKAATLRRGDIPTGSARDRSEFLVIKLLMRRPARSGKFGYYGLRTTAAPFGPTHPAR
jgi:hypothetical protein